VLSKGSAYVDKFLKTGGNYMAQRAQKGRPEVDRNSFKTAL